MRRRAVRLLERRRPWERFWRLLRPFTPCCPCSHWPLALRAPVLPDHHQQRKIRQGWELPPGWLAARLMRCQRMRRVRRNCSLVSVAGKPQPRNCYGHPAVWTDGACVCACSAGHQWQTVRIAFMPPPRSTLGGGATQFCPGPCWRGVSGTIRGARGDVSFHVHGGGFMYTCCSWVG
jgi:hypothetical protein